jgi:hypothetical protein
MDEEVAETANSINILDPGKINDTINGLKGNITSLGSSLSEGLNNLKDMGSNLLNAGKGLFGFKQKDLLKRKNRIRGGKNISNMQNIIDSNRIDGNFLIKCNINIVDYDATNQNAYNNMNEQYLNSELYQTNFPISKPL